MTDDYDGSDDAQPDNGDDDTRQPSRKEITAFIKGRLAEMRPEHYDPADPEWQETMEKIAVEVKEKLTKTTTSDQIVQDHARSLVHRYELNAPKELNRHLRTITDAQLTLFDALIEPIRDGLPASIRIVKKGKTVGHRRFKFGAATRADTIECENGMRRDAAEVFKAASKAADAWPVIREGMDDANADRVDGIQPHDDDNPSSDTTE